MIYNLEKGMSLTLEGPASFMVVRQSAPEAPQYVFPSTMHTWGGFSPVESHYGQSQGYAPVVAPNQVPQATPYAVPQAVPQMVPTNMVPQQVGYAVPHTPPPINVPMPKDPGVQFAADYLTARGHDQMATELREALKEDADRQAAEQGTSQAYAVMQEELRKALKAQADRLHAEHKAAAQKVKEAVGQSNPTILEKVKAIFDDGDGAMSGSKAK